MNTWRLEVDRGLWVTWYDLPDDKRDAFLPWLHGAYIPKLLQKTGMLWAAHYAVEKLDVPSRVRHTEDRSVPTGNDYILLFGAETTHAFSKGAQTFTAHAPNKLHSDLSEADRSMLSMRVNERVNIFTEEARVDGPEARLREGSMVPGPCIQLGSFNGNSCQAEDELLAWYADWRMPALKILPGCVGVRKLVSVSGWARHGVLYEFVSLEVRNEQLRALARLYPEMEAWTNAFVPKLTHAYGSPHVARRIWPAVS